MPTAAAYLSYGEVLNALAEATRPAGASLALLLLDVADLPNVQARLGFEASAALLESMGVGFETALTHRGSVLRFGEGRFCIVVNAIRNRGHAQLAAEKLIRVAQDAMNAAGVSIKPQISIGVALFPSQTSEPGSLLRYAQLAGAAARSQSARMKIFDDGCEGQVLQSWQLSEAFAKALDSGELSVFYQPKIRIADGRTAGAEALLRWTRDDVTIATPDVFIPLAEESGLIQNVTWYVISNALRLAEECSSLAVAINVTPAMLHHREFMGMMRTAVSTWGVPPHQLTVEITEGALIADFDEAISRLAALRDAGLRVSIDDFGTGYSSLSYFKKIPADELKIDKSFILRMLQDPADRRLVATIIGLAQQFKMEIVAEGVEDRATLDALAAMGCHYAQGFLFSAAVSAAQIKHWMQHH